LNNVTHNDLSFNETKLDFEALFKTAAYATRELREQVNRYQSKLGDDLLHNDVTGIHLNSQWLADTAHDLAIAADTYSALLGAKTRDNLEVINKPVDNNQ